MRELAELGEVHTRAVYRLVSYRRREAKPVLSILRSVIENLLIGVQLWS